MECEAGDFMWFLCSDAHVIFSSTLELWDGKTKCQKGYFLKLLNTAKIPVQAIFPGSAVYAETMSEVKIEQNLVLYDPAISYDLSSYYLTC